MNMTREIHTRIHKNLEWFRPSERNTIHPLLYIALVRAWITELEEASGCVLPEKGLNELRARLD
jgi:hypothetical protein